MQSSEITLNMKAVTNSITSQNQTFPAARWTRADLAEQIERVENAKGITGGYNAELRRLQDMIVSAYKSIGKYGLEASIRALSFADLKSLAENEELPARYDNIQLVKALDEGYLQYPKRTDYVELIVQRLADKEFKDENGELLDSPFLTIVKQFVKYGVESAAIVKLVLEKYPMEGIKNPSKEKKLQHVLNNLGEDILDLYYEKFSVLEKEKEEKHNIFADIKKSYSKNDLEYKEANKAYETAKSKAKEFADMFEVLFLADDLSNGKLKRSRQNQTTKHQLYKFAVVFNMMYYTNEEKSDGTRYNRFIDIEKNLFEDYYTASLFDKSDDSERINLGDGIDYKNYAEVIYLYFIRQRRPVESTEENRVKQAEAMIKSCKKYFSESEVISDSESENYFELTEDFRKQIPFDTNADEFESLIKLMYLGRAANTNNAWECPNQITASEEYKKLIIKLKGKKLDNYLDSTVFDCCSISFKEAVSTVYEIILECYNDVVESKTEFAGDYVSREKIICLHLFAYLAKYKERCAESNEFGIKPQKVFNDFSDDLNNLLDDCRYQRFTEKNLFDVIILSIVYINIY